MKKLLFIDRDGTIITEPEDEQIDSFEKLEFYPYAISNLSRIAQLDFGLVMVTNQDGLGTASFPEDTFWPVQNKILDILDSEGVKFDNIHIDRSFPNENMPTRKPGTAMLTQYLTPDYDIKNSYVIGDRLTDIELAYNLGCRGILLQPEDKGEEMLEGKEYNPSCVLITDKWIDIYTFLRHGERTAVIERKTAETNISIFLDLDGGKDDITTGLHFFDHMLQQLVHHAGVGLEIEVLGDLHVDEHHTIEDTAIALGEAFYNALGSKRGIERYGYALPMDECNALVLLDFGGRIDFDWQVDFTRERIGDVPTEMFKHFFKSFAESARCNLHIKATGENEHHKIEGVFKVFARAIKMAIRRNAFSNDVPSSKGIL